MPAAEFIETFLQSTSLEERKSGSAKYLNKYSHQRIPVILDRAKSDAPKPNRNKFLCSANMSLSEFAMSVRSKHLKSLKPAEALFWHVVEVREGGGSSPPQIEICKSPVAGSFTLSELHSASKHVDGFLYICYSKEACFG